MGILPGNSLGSVQWVSIALHFVYFGTQPLTDGQKDVKKDPSIGADDTVWPASWMGPHSFIYYYLLLNTIYYALTKSDICYGISVKI